MKISEKELAKSLSDYLGGNLFFEVTTVYGATDIVFTDEEERTHAIEVKTQFSFEVMQQATQNKQCYDYSSIAVPILWNNKSNKINSFKKQICEKFGIGVYVIEYLNLDLNNYLNTWRQAIKPPLNHNIKDFYRPQLRDYLRQNTPGTNGKRITAWRQMIIDICAIMVANNGKATTAMIYNGLDSKYKKEDALHKALYGHCRNGVIKEFKYLGSKYWELVPEEYQKLLTEYNLIVNEQ